ncbi:MAG: hypothetical protein RLP12_06030, partial [Ekhidna sp.]
APFDNAELETKIFTEIDDEMAVSLMRRAASRSENRANFWNCLLSIVLYFIESQKYDAARHQIDEIEKELDANTEWDIVNETFMRRKRHMEKLILEGQSSS